MACLFCLEITKETLTSKQLSKLFSELLQSGDKEHLKEYDKALAGISDGYKQKLNEETNEEWPDSGDTFDPF